MVFGFLIERKWLQENREIHDVVPTKKMVPLIMCEITLSGHVREMVSGVNVSNLNLGIMIILSNNQTNATLKVRRKTSALYDHHSLFVFKNNVQLGFEFMKVLRL